MAITLGETTISGLGVGGLPSGSVNSTSLAANSVTRDKIAYSGATLQMVTNYTDTVTTASDVSTWLETFITPTSSSSQILIMGTLSGMAQDDSVVRLEFKIGGGGWQNTTALNSNQYSYSGIGDLAWSHRSNGGPFPFTVIAAFSPGTTSQVGVRFYHNVESSSTFYLNRADQGVDNSENFGTGRSRMTLMEIRG